MEERENKRMKLEINKRRSPVLPYDIIFQILLRVLPNASLLQLRRVSREFDAVITDTTFARLRPPTPKSVLIQVGRLWEKENEPIKLLLATKQQGNILLEKISIENPTKERDMPQLICACDGLLCFLSPDCLEKYKSCPSYYCILTVCSHVTEKVASRFHVYNSLTEEWITTPRLEQRPACGVCGFYRHVPTGEYRILLHAENGFHIHALGSDFWRIVSHLPTWYSQLKFERYDWCHRRPPVLMHGKLHFSCNFLSGGLGEEVKICEPGILVFCTDVEEFRFIKKPPEPNMGYPDKEALYPFETEHGLGYPTVNGDRMIAIWVLKDYEKELWVKQYTIYSEGMIGHNIHFGKSSLIFSEDGEVWACHGDTFEEKEGEKEGKVILYDQRSSTCKETFYYYPISYKARETLSCFSACYWGSLSSINAFKLK